MSAAMPASPPASVPAAVPGCPLCEGDGGTVLWRDAWLRVVRVDDPAFPGFVRVIWHAHEAEMSDLDDAGRQHLLVVLNAVERAVRDCLTPDKINLASFGNQVPHLHWHVIPRWRWDTRFPDSPWSAERRPADAARLAGAQARADGLPQRLEQALGALTPSP